MQKLLLFISAASIDAVLTTGGIALLQTGNATDGLGEIVKVFSGNLTSSVILFILFYLYHNSEIKKWEQYRKSDDEKWSSLRESDDNKWKMLIDQINTGRANDFKMLGNSIEAFEGLAGRIQTMVEKVNNIIIKIDFVVDNIPKK